MAWPHSETSGVCTATQVLMLGIYSTIHPGLLWRCIATLARPGHMVQVAGPSASEPEHDAFCSGHHPKLTEFQVIL